MLVVSVCAAAVYISLQYFMLTRASFVLFEISQCPVGQKSFSSASCFPFRKTVIGLVVPLVTPASCVTFPSVSSVYQVDVLICDAEIPKSTSNGIPNGLLVASSTYLPLLETIWSLI